MASVAPAPAMLAPSRERAEGALATITVEKLAWATLVVMAALTRFWELGAKALHHDESLHSYYSWIWAAGRGEYAHDPLMHGPLLFHLNALVYFLFGASDATSRYAPAATGILIVWLPYLLRGPRLLGKWGALSTSALLLISPTILYQSRYIRHDVYTVAGALLMFICIMRYVQAPERKWLVTFLVTTALMLANHEVIFAIIGLFGAFLYGAVIIDRFGHWRHTHRDLVSAIFGLHVFAFLSALGLVLFMPHRYVDRFLAIPWDSSGRESLPPTRHNQSRLLQGHAQQLADCRSGSGRRDLYCRHDLPVALLQALFRFGERLARRRGRPIPSAALREILADHKGLAIGGALFLFTFSGCSRRYSPTGMASSRRPSQPTGRCSTGSVSTMCNAALSPGSTSCCCFPSMSSCPSPSAHVWHCSRSGGPFGF